MTARTSLFNGGIYKSTIRRYRLGSILYFVLLFLSTVMPILFGFDPETYYPRANQLPVILQDGYYILPALCSFFVPTVVALLVFRFLHAKKTSIFVHSLPVSRTANYVSTIAAALTLMLVPILLNGLILMVLPLCGYGLLFSISDCIIWIGINALSVFLMFSVATVSACLTGNSFAMVVINGFLHGVAFLIAGGISLFSGMFLYGYFETSRLFNLASSWNFIGYIGGFPNFLTPEVLRFVPFDWVRLGIMALLAVVLYVLGWLLYRRRRMETAEDVAAYRVLNPIFKYLLTFIAAAAAFLLASETLKDGIWFAVLLVLIVSVVTYFGIEMVLRKNLKVWRSYKGYLVFLAVFTGFVCFYAFTGVFGFENRIPDADKVAAVAVTENGWHEEGRFVENEEVKAYVLALHKELLAPELHYTLRDHKEDRPHNLHIVYQMENGKTMTRRYYVDEETLYRVMDELYAWRDYKLANIELFREKIGEIQEIDVGALAIEDKAQIEELLGCLTADLLEVDFSETTGGSVWGTGIHVEYKPENYVETEENYRIVYSVYQQITASFKRTVAWLITHGYAEELFDRGGRDFVVLTGEQWNRYVETREKTAYEESHKTYYTTAEVAVSERPTIEEIPGVVRITSADDKAKITSIVLNTPVRYVPEKEYAYYVGYLDENGYINQFAAFYDDASGISKYNR